MSLIRIAFLGTPEFARHHLASMLKDEHFEVVGVVSQPDRPSGRNMKLTASPVKTLALAHDIKILTPENINDPEILKQIYSWRVEAVVVVAYGQILSQKFLNMFPGRVVNVHASLLPRWRGAAPIQRAIAAGDVKTGVSLQVMVKKMDAGAVIGSYPIQIGENLTALELHDQLLPLGQKLLREDFMDYLRGNLTPQAQIESLVTYAPKIEKSEAQILWSKTSLEIHNHVRAMSMGPGSVCSLSGKKLKLIKTVLGPDISAEPGKIITIGKEELIVACGQGSLKVLAVQPESRPRMNLADFLLGHPIREGMIFE